MRSQIVSGLEKAFWETVVFLWGPQILLNFLLQLPLHTILVESSLLLCFTLSLWWGAAGPHGFFQIISMKVDLGMTQNKCPPVSHWWLWYGMKVRITWPNIWSTWIGTSRGAVFWARPDGLKVFMRLLLYLLSSFRGSSPFERSRCWPRQDGPVEVGDFWLSSKIMWQLPAMAEGCIFQLEHGSRARWANLFVWSSRSIHIWYRHRCNTRIII